MIRDSNNGLTREQVLYEIYILNAIEKYESMFEKVSHLIRKFGTLSISEKNMLEKPFKQIVKKNQLKLYSLHSLTQSTEDEQIKLIILEEKKQIEDEIRNLCFNVIGLIDVYLHTNVKEV